MFKPGDIVRHKSGSPAMTVTSVPADRFVCQCSWFIDDEVKSHAFTHESLEPA